MMTPRERDAAALFGVCVASAVVLLAVSTVALWVLHALLTVVA